jgi:hypothetical protein
MRKRRSGLETFKKGIEPSLNWLWLSDRLWKLGKSSGRAKKALEVLHYSNKLLKIHWKFHWNASEHPWKLLA